MRQFADDLAGLLDALAIDEPVVLCGTSMGGYIALQFWKDYRARLGGLILCDTRAGADSPDTVQAHRQTADRIEREGPAALADAMLPRLLAPGTFDDRPHLVRELRGRMTSGNPRGIAAAAPAWPCGPTSRRCWGRSSVPR